MKGLSDRWSTACSAECEYILMSWYRCQRAKPDSQTRIINSPTAVHGVPILADTGLCPQWRSYSGHHTEVPWAAPLRYCSGHKEFGRTRMFWGMSYYPKGMAKKRLISQCFFRRPVHNLHSIALCLHSLLQAIRKLAPPSKVQDDLEGFAG